MAEKKYNDNPRVTDTVVFDITTPDASGCLTTDPYKVDRLVVYYVERNFLGNNFGEYEKVKYNDTLLAQTLAAEQLACASPTPANIFAAQQLRNELESKAQRNQFFFKDAVPVKTVGTSLNPAWLSSDEDNSQIEHVTEDEDGNPQFGRFRFKWMPNGSVREGDYFICWTWTPLPAGDSLSAHESFSMLGDPRAVTTIPSHITPEEKYEVLLERYLPEVYKNYLADKDITPETTYKLNRAVAKGFKYLEDLANQVIDLYDANALHESLLVYLSNLFSLKLKSDDPTLWRRQIKNAITLFKKKGTIRGLQEAFAQAGMKLEKLTQLWQVVSQYTWVESFRVKDSPVFTLSKRALPVDPDNFGLWVRRQGDGVYQEVLSDCVIFEDTDCNFATRMIWVGDELSSNPISLFEGDIIKILYKYKELPIGQQPIENYIRSLDLADERDEADQEFPPKNWNVRVIEEDDPLFGVVVPVRHPFHEALVFGWVRTEFPYSENVYNMEEYNGSTRETGDPCLIDKAFTDPCGSCISSKFNIDVSVESLSDDRLSEVRDIIREYTPFHAQVHRINFYGSVNEFVPPPVENIECLVTYRVTDIVLSGNSNLFFTRIMPDGWNLSTLGVARDALAQNTLVVSATTGIGYNPRIAVVTPNVNLQKIGLDLANHVFEVLSPSINSGAYTISNPIMETATVNGGVSEPVNESMFTFHLSNITYENSQTIITQDDKFSFTSESVDFVSLGVKTLWDVENTPDYAGGSWKVSIPAYDATPYEIKEIVEGVLILADPGRTLPTTVTSGINFELLDDTGVTRGSAIDGNLSVERFGRVDLNDNAILDIREFVRVNDKFIYNNFEYRVSGLDEQKFIIEDYVDGDVSGATVEIRRRLVENEIGFFGYAGLKLQTVVDYETSLGILNGENGTENEDEITDNSKFKENFLVKIGDDYYKIVAINATDITLDGPSNDWMTLGAGGTLVNFSIHHFVESPVATSFLLFDNIDRRGRDTVVRETFSTVTQDTEVVAFATGEAEPVPRPNGFFDKVEQNEKVSYTIEYKSGKKSTGEL
jgi:hypothetical protein